MTRAHAGTGRYRRARRHRRGRRADRPNKRDNYAALIEEGVVGAAATDHANSRRVRRVRGGRDRLTVDGWGCRQGQRVVGAVDRDLRRATDCCFFGPHPAHVANQRQPGQVHIAFVDRLQVVVLRRGRSKQRLNAVSLTQWPLVHCSGANHRVPVVVVHRRRELGRALDVAGVSEIGAVVYIGVTEPNRSRSRLFRDVELASSSAAIAT